jgi:hypothetical protein
MICERPFLRVFFISGFIPSPLLFAALDFLNWNYSAFTVLNSGKQLLSKYS